MSARACHRNKKTDGYLRTHPSFETQNAKVLDGFLQFLSGAEGDLLARLDLDRFAGRGIAAHARGALAHLQDAGTVETDALALLQVLGHHRDEIVDDRATLLVGEALLVGELVGELLGGQGYGLRFCSCCCRCHCCLVWRENHKEALFYGISRMSRNRHRKAAKTAVQNGPEKSGESRHRLCPRHANISKRSKEKARRSGLF